MKKYSFLLLISMSFMSHLPAMEHPHSSEIAQSDNQTDASWQCPYQECNHFFDSQDQVLEHLKGHIIVECSLCQSKHLYKDITAHCLTHQDMLQEQVEFFKNNLSNDFYFSGLLFYYLDKFKNNPNKINAHIINAYSQIYSLEEVLPLKPFYSELSQKYHLEQIISLSAQYDKSNNSLNLSSTTTVCLPVEKTKWHYHSNDKPFACTPCTMTFRIGGELATHLRDTHRVHPYRCNEDNCEKYFIYWGDLNNHLKSKHYKTFKRLSPHHYNTQLTQVGKPDY